MINVLGNLKSIPLSKFRPEDFGMNVDGVSRLAIDTAYREVGWLRRGLDLRANGVMMMPFDVLHGGEVVYQDNSDNDPLPDVLDIFPVLGQMVLDLDKYGAAYAIFEANAFGRNRAWRRLHPSTITPEYSIKDGSLAYFRRRVNGGEFKYKPEDLLYIWMPADTGENGHGTGVGYTALLSATVLSYKDKFSAKFFENGALSPTLVQMKGFATQPEEEKKRVSSLLNRLMTGLRNAFKIIPIDGELGVHSLMQPIKDMAMGEMTIQQRESMATTLGIPQSLLFSNATNFATAQQDDIHFYDKTIVPFVRWVIQYQLNEQLFAPAGYRLKYVKSRLEVFQRQESEKAYALMTLYDRQLVSANEIRGVMDMALFADDFYSTGVPGDNEVTISGDGNEVIVDDEPDVTRPVEKKALPMVGDEAYVVIDLSNRPELIQMQNVIRQAMSGNEGVHFEDPENFHVTLVYCFDISPQALEKVVIDGRHPFDIRVSGIGIFNNPGGRALYLMVDHTHHLDFLQKRIWVEFGGHNTSDYSVPQKWQPHITMAYLPDDVDMPQIHFMPFELSVDVIQYMRDDYQVVYEVAEETYPTNAKTYPASGDLDKWQRLALKRWKEGTPEKALTFESDLIPAGLQGAIAGHLSAAQNADDVRLIFDDAMAYVEVH